ncbi:MAG: hypothetical protein QOJ38_157 [Solirubrobacterales bacterium]|jgi:ubiquinone/menaquinone biosynthesis C-methylase UbiE|nr:hypothetical protein [Solirubrobacterales bacterium]
MNAAQMDPAEFREKQKADWNIAAKGWRKWSDTIDAGAHVVSERLVELAEVKPGNTVLDVACGYGEPSLTAAQVAGPDGKVVATDQAGEMLAYGRERAAARGLDNVEFVEAGAAALDYGEGTFDAAVSRWGIIFEPEPEQIAGQIRGFLKPGAKFAISSWGAPDTAPMIAVPMQTALGILELPPPPPGSPGPLARPTPEAISALLEGGGLSDVKAEDLTTSFSWDSPEDFMVYCREIIAPLTALVAQYPDKADAVWDGIAKAAGEYADGDGRVTLENQVLVAVGTA